MSDGQVSNQDQKIAAKQDEVQSLRTRVFAISDNPASDSDLLQELAKAEKALEELESANPSDQDSKRTRGNNDFYLGATTTGVEVTTEVRMHPLPTGIYHLLDSEKQPLVTVNIDNKSNKTQRLRIRTYLEGLSAEAVRSVEIESGRQSNPINLLPTLHLERTKQLTQVSRATLHVIVEDLDTKKLECHNTHQITCLSRNSSLNSAEDPKTGKLIELTHFYAAWVTPHVTEVMKCVRRAAELTPDKNIVGYQGDETVVRNQVKALFESLKACGITYVNSIIEFGRSKTQFTQRTRLPRESIEEQSANCIDGTVLMASLLEAASLNPGIVVIPGHAFLAWETDSFSGKWEFLETTMIGTSGFEGAVQSGRLTYENMHASVPSQVKLHSLRPLRRRGIWPME